MVKPVPQNIAGTFSDHERCGASCTIGCRGHENVEDALGKMSGCRAFLAPLIDDKSSEAPIVQGLGEFEVDRVIFDENDPKRAIGAVGWAKVGSEHKLVVVKAKSVVVSGGTLSSPAILLRSGVKVSLLDPLSDLPSLDRFVAYLLTHRIRIWDTTSTFTRRLSSTRPGPKL